MARNIERLVWPDEWRGGDGSSLEALHCRAARGLLRGSRARGQSGACCSADWRDQAERGTSAVVSAGLCWTPFLIAGSGGALAVSPKPASAEEGDFCFSNWHKLTELRLWLLILLEPAFTLLCFPVAAEGSRELAMRTMALPSKVLNEIRQGEGSQPGT